jgi:hypothetical protein
MVEVVVVWLVWLGVVALFAAFVPIWWTRKRKIHERSEEQSTLANAMTDWLQQKRIVQAILESGAFTAKQLQFTFEAIPWMSEYQLRTAAAAVLKDRMVRRVIAAYMEKEHGTDHNVVLQALKQWSDAA